MSNTNCGSGLLDVAPSMRSPGDSPRSPGLNDRNQSPLASTKHLHIELKNTGPLTSQQSAAKTNMSVHSGRKSQNQTASQFMQGAE